MNVPEIYESEYRFCLILWANEPIQSGELVKLCARELEWKKSTTYTVIKRLSDRGVVKNENGTVTSLVSKDEVQTVESRQFVDKTFGGSLPSFLTAFTNGRKLSAEEADEIRRIIDEHREG